jgi:hypothetical protein
MNEYQLGRVAGLKLSAAPRAAAGTVLLWALLTVVGVGLLDLSFGQGVIGGLIATVLHWVSELVHQLGHAWAARRTGHRMIGVRFGQWLVLGTSLYPPDEGALLAAVHVRRALGGPTSSTLLTGLAGLIALASRPADGVLWWVALFFFLENLSLFTLGAFLPLGFTDGGTLLEWWPRR